MKAENNKNAEWLEEDTRSSKAAARDAGRAAFRAYLRQEYGESTVATAFVKFPSIAIDKLIGHWAEYVQTEAYLKRRQHSQQQQRAPPSDFQVPMIHAS